MKKKKKFFYIEKGLGKEIAAICAKKGKEKREELIFEK